MKTFVCYDKNGKEVKTFKNNQELIAVYGLKNINELKEYITYDIFEKTYYVQEFKWNNNTTKNEDGSWKDSSEWERARTKKYYIHKLWNKDV